MPRKPETSVDANEGLEIYLLDMGKEQYGDCILAKGGGQSILIDGGHPKDGASIERQLREIMGNEGSIKVSLLVVTHCHTDHIGCLPDLVERGVLKADHALVADEKYGFGRLDTDASLDDAPSPGDRLAAALREEDYSKLPDSELVGVLADAATSEPRYKRMLKSLEAAGTQVIRYRGTRPKALEAKFKAIGLQVIGPSKEQLIKARDVIAGLNHDAVDLVAKAGDADDPAQFITMYRDLIRISDSMTGEDRPGKGAATNDQSIILTLGPKGARALLGGDMQFAAPEVSGLSQLMSALRTTVKNEGPYQFIKMSHHASYNGFDASLMSEWSDTHAYACSNGTDDSSHPDHGVLKLLKGHASELQWARTDRNGRVLVRLGGKKPKFVIRRGRMNDFTPNGDVGPSETELESQSVETSVKVSAGAGGIREVSATAKLDGGSKKVTITFEATDSGVGASLNDRGTRTVSSGVEPAPKDLKLAGGRKLPKLLFVTHAPGLENNIGKLEARSALQLIRDGGQALLEVKNPENPYKEVRAKLQDDFAGVVVVGGYDVLPSRNIDVLPSSLRKDVGAHSSEPDNYMVWNDGAYGDRTGDLLADVPVSRIPDARSPRLVMNALSAGSPSNGVARFGIRNYARPFAQGPYALLKGNAELLVSMPSSPTTVNAGGATGSHVYFMLHGSDFDATRFWGEEKDGSMLEALNILSLPRSVSGVVFTGCCWGALTVQTLAKNYVKGQPLGIRTPGTSIALSYLNAGMKAFVGCTGVHYSPTEAPYDYFGGPMHRAFWTYYNQGMGPAEALHQAKIEYLTNLPHGMAKSKPSGKAIEFKILRQYTCLGLGW